MTSGKNLIAIGNFIFPSTSVMIVVLCVVCFFYACHCCYFHVFARDKQKESRIEKTEHGFFVKLLLVWLNRNTSVGNAIRITLYSIPLSQIAIEALRRSSFDVLEMVRDRDVVQTRPITKLYLFDLEDMVSNEDIHLLFSEEGVLERYSIHYD
ncbi:hypothetical protein RYX36_033841 [Vicia faba]